MSLDLYVGSLSRFLERDFLTPQARLARDEGLDYRLETENPHLLSVTKNQADKAVVLFQDWIVEGAEHTTVWDDANVQHQSRQLFTQCNLALMHLLAHRLTGQGEFPLRYFDFPGLSLEAYGYSDDYKSSPFIAFEAHYIMPMDLTKLTFVEFPGRGQGLAASILHLERAIEVCAKIAFDNDIQIESWLDAGSRLPSSSTQFEKGRFSWSKGKSRLVETTPSEDGANLRNAQYAFAVWYDAFQFAQKNNLPICQDG
jgi:hypothetical protein